MKNQRVGRLAAYLDDLGLSAFVSGLLEAGGEPLAFLAAQGLHIAQPALGLFVDEARVAALARRLEDPAAVAQMAAQLRSNR